MRKIICIALTAVSLSCASVTAPERTDITSLKKLFELCASDLENAKKVIVERDLIKNLSHLQRMDGGGDKYYLLEREGITDMIKAVTEGIYAEFVLINRDGTVVYTMKNNAIFSGTVRAGGALSKTALADCYENRDIVPYIAGVPFLPGDENAYVAISAKIAGGNTMPGIFILLVEMRKIQDLIGVKSLLVDMKGNCEVARAISTIKKPYKDFDKIDLSRPGYEIGEHRFTRSGGGSAGYRFFRYGAQEWVIIRED